MKIKSIFLLLTMCLALSGLIHAQTDEIYRAEVYCGYLFNSAQSSSSSGGTYVIPGEYESTTTTSESSSTRKNMHGFNCSVTGNPGKMGKSVGWKFDASDTRRTDTSGSGTGATKIKSSLQQYLGGVQFKNNVKDGGTFKPFAHVLAGLARQYVGTSGGTSNNRRNDFAMLFGGGIDVKLGKRIDLRLIQVDYNPIFVKTRNGIEGKTQHNFRIGVGIVFH